MLSRTNALGDEKWCGATRQGKRDQTSTRAALSAAAGSPLARRRRTRSNGGRETGRRRDAGSGLGEEGGVVVVTPRLLARTLRRRDLQLGAAWRCGFGLNRRARRIVLTSWGEMNDG